MKIQEIILEELKQINSIDFWEDCLIFDYERTILNQEAPIKEDIFNYLLDNIYEINGDNKYVTGFILDLLTLPHFDSKPHFVKLLDKLSESNQDFIYEKLIDNLRDWELSKDETEKLFLLKNKIINKSSLVFKIIENK